MNLLSIIRIALGCHALDLRALIQSRRTRTAITIDLIAPLAIFSWASGLKGIENSTENDEFLRNAA